MKKTIAALMMALILLVTCAAFAEFDSWTTVTTEKPWYELSWEGDILTVRLTQSTKTGLYWKHENTNPDSIELLTSETFAGEEQGMAGAETIYAASFRAIGNCEGNAALIFQCVASEEGSAEYTRVLQLETSADNKIRIASVEEIEPFADWCETTNDGEVLTVRMPSADWKFEIVDPDVASLITCDSSSGKFVASFMATMERAGFGEIVFTSDDGLNSRTVNVFANEGGTLSVEDVSTFKIFYAPNLVYCDACGGWFEEGVEFDTHTCVTPEADPTPVDFQTVSVTGNSVNMREGAGVDYASIRVLKKGNHAKYLGETKQDASGMKWYKISYADKTGWISAKYSKLAGTGYIKVIDGNCNLRQAPNLDGKILTTLKKGTIVNYKGYGTTDERGVDWYRVSYNGKEGYMTSKYASFTANSKPESKTEYKYVVISGGDAHLRDKASTNGISLAVIKNGGSASYLGEKTKDERGVEWYKASYNGRTGWVSSKYGKISTSTTAPKTTDDMRLVYNPNRYDVIRVSDIFSQDGRTYYIDCCFGRIGKDGDPEKFDASKTVRLVLNPGAEVLLPADLDNLQDLSYVDDPAIWFANACKQIGSGFKFYATFSMNEGGAIRSLAYLYVD